MQARRPRAAGRERRGPRLPGSAQSGKLKPSWMPSLARTWSWLFTEGCFECSPGIRRQSGIQQAPLHVTPMLPTAPTASLSCREVQPNRSAHSRTSYGSVTLMRWTNRCARRWPSTPDVLVTTFPRPSSRRGPRSGRLLAERHLPVRWSRALERGVVGHSHLAPLGQVNRAAHSSDREWLPGQGALTKSHLSGVTRGAAGLVQGARLHSRAVAWGCRSRRHDPCGSPPISSC